MNTLNTINMNEVVTLLNSKLEAFKIENKKSCVYRGKPSFDFDYYDDGFEITIRKDKDKDTDVRVMFSANIDTKDLVTGEQILEFTKVVLDRVEIDTATETYELVCNYTLADVIILENVGTDIATNATYYNLVSDDIYTTDDIDATYSEMSVQYEKYDY